MSRTQRRIRKFLNWRTGTVILIALILIIGIGQIFGAWEPLWRALFGTAFPPPEGGYTCLPTCSETDGKFLSMPGEQMASFGGEKIVVWIGVPAGYDSFELGIFDGDSGKDNNGNVNWWGGNWDNTTTETTYTLYADPLKDGKGTQVIRTWQDRAMPNNAWFTDNIPVGSEAQAPSGHYFYRLEVTRPVQGYGINALKLRSSGYLSTGQADLVNANFAIVGMLATMNDVYILYPQFSGDWTAMGESPYDGDWEFRFYLSNATDTIEFWDGDFDRGAWVTTVDIDTDDPNTVGKPAWASPYAVDERAGGRGSPADDAPFALYRRDPPVWYEIIDPTGQPIYTNDEPSGTEEWEHFVASRDPSVNADRVAGEPFQPGWYGWHIVGLDVHNTVWIRTNYEVADQPPPPIWPEGSCPRTIGYWKNNVKKVLIQGKTQGTQETRESLEAALDAVAAASPLFRSGIDVHNPQPIQNVARLTDQEANAILQKEAGNTMLDRALQQNLATWLNLGSGKIGPNTVIHLPNGTFDGTVWEALQTAQEIILYHRDDPVQLERAKNIADYINNGLLGEEAEDSTCEDYVQVIPPDKQPPPYEDLPESPEQPNPPPPNVGCDSPRVNQYNVVNPTDNPFYGIKFEFASGSDVKDGAYDEFRFTLPADVVAGMTSMQLEAKAGTDVGQVVLEGCVLNQFTPCENSVSDPNGFFTFSYQGAVDNNDGTLTLVFHVENHTGHGLSHATFGLPGGQVPSWPGGTYESQVCP